MDHYVAEKPTSRTIFLLCKHEKNKKKKCTSNRKIAFLFFSICSVCYSHKYVSRISCQLNVAHFSYIAKILQTLSQLPREYGWWKVKYTENVTWQTLFRETKIVSMSIIIEHDGLFGRELKMRIWTSVYLKLIIACVMNNGVELEHVTWKWCLDSDLQSSCFRTEIKLADAHTFT